MKKISVIVFVLAVLVASSAQAVIVLPTDGAGGNTVRTSDGGTDWLGSAETATTWRDRSDWAGYAPGLPVAAYGNSSTSLAPELRTTIEGLDPFEEVEVWVLFSASFNMDGTLRKNCWIDSAVDDGSAMTAFSLQAGNAVQTGLISRPSEYEGDNLYYEVLAGYMGTVMADEDGFISLLADTRIVAPDGSGYSNGDRSILHGYALYEAPVVPEPATMTLLGLGSLALLRKRRK